MSSVIRFAKALITICIAASLLACERVDVDTLPEVPRVRFDTFLPGVQTQLGQAYAAVDDDPSGAAENGRLAMLLQTYKQFDAAEVMYARTRLIEPNQFDWAYLHGVVLSATGQPAKAADALTLSLTLVDEYPWAKIRLAELKAEQGDLTGADQLYDEVMRTAIPFSEAFFSHGKFLLDRGRIDQAIQAFEQTLRLSGNLGAAYYQLGLAYRQQGKLELAQQNFALAKKHQGYSADSSDRVLNKLLPLNLSDTPFVHRAKVLAESGRFDQAQKFIEMALERNPESVAAHASMIGMAARLGDFARVDHHFDTAVAIAPDNAKIYFNLGVARIAEQRLIEAASAFEQSIERDNTDPNAHVQLATLRHQSGQIDDARKFLGRALELEPSHQTANWLMGELIFDAGAPAEAEAHLIKAVASEHAMAPMMLAKLAEIRLALNNVAGASEALTQARLGSTDRFGAGLAARLKELEQQVSRSTGDVAPRDTVAEDAVE